MEIEHYPLEGVISLTPRLFQDDRGYFFESFNQTAFDRACEREWIFVQDNQSLSKRKGTIRGLHCQLNPQAQGKLVRVIQGAIQDVAVDIRKSSPTFGQWIECELSAENRKQLWIPPGFLHGFCTLSDDVVVQYKCTASYSPEHDRSVIYNDSRFAVKWRLDGSEPVLSDKDLRAPQFTDQDWF